MGKARFPEWGGVRAVDWSKYAGGEEGYDVAGALEVLRAAKCSSDDDDDVGDAINRFLSGHAWNQETIYPVTSKVIPLCSAAGAQSGYELAVDVQAALSAEGAARRRVARWRIRPRLHDDHAERRRAARKPPIRRQRPR